jgi:hypothetical protein
VAGVRRLGGARVGRRAADLAARRAHTDPAWVLLWREPDPKGGCGRREESAVPPAVEARYSDGFDGRDTAGVARPRGQRAAAPDGGSSTWSSTTPTAWAATCWRCRTATGTGVDHGVSFTSAKLRTVLWGWLGALLPEEGPGGRAAAVGKGARRPAGDLLSVHLSTPRSTRPRPAAGGWPSAP